MPLFQPDGHRFESCRVRHKSPDHSLRRSGSSRVVPPVGPGCDRGGTRPSTHTSPIPVPADSVGAPRRQSRRPASRLLHGQQRGTTPTGYLLIEVSRRPTPVSDGRRSRHTPQPPPHPTRNSCGGRTTSTSPTPTLPGPGTCCNAWLSPIRCPPPGARTQRRGGSLVTHDPRPKEETESSGV